VSLLRPCSSRRRGPFMSARWISTSDNVCPGSEKALRRPPRAPTLSISGLSHPYHDSLTVARVDTTQCVLQVPRGPLYLREQCGLLIPSRRSLLRPRLAVLSRKSLARLLMRTHDLRVPANAFCGTVNDGMLGAGFGVRGIQVRARSLSLEPLVH
jgi:hypothetical protein